MDLDLRQLERMAFENPAAYYRAIRRSGQLDILKAEDPVEWLKTLQRCNRLGPTNLAVLGMLGYRPAVAVMGGEVNVENHLVYWYKGRWFTEEQMLREKSGWHWARDLGRTGAYRICLNRLSFYIRKIEWMRDIAVSMKPNEHLAGYLEFQPNRVRLLQAFLKEL